MQLDETARRVIDQYLTARLTSAQASLQASPSLQDGVLSADATKNFLLIADLMRRWHALGHSEGSRHEHRGRLILDFFMSSSQFMISRQKRLPLLVGDEATQAQLIRNLWEEFYFTIRQIPVRISQRGDKLTFRFEYKKLPLSYLQVFSQRHSEMWLMSNLTLPNLTAWLWEQELLEAEIKPSAISTQPHRFTLTFSVMTQLSLPIS